MGDGPPLKRRKKGCGPDGMKVLNPITIRRKELAVERALAAERMRLYGECAAALSANRELKMREDDGVEQGSAPEPPGSADNPRIINDSDDAGSSDFGMPATTDAPQLADEYEDTAAVKLFPARFSCSTVTSDSDEIWDNNDAAAIVSSSECSYDDIIGSGVGDLPSRESSSGGTDDGASSPIRADFDRNNFRADKVREYLHSDSGDTVMFSESNTKSWQVVLLILGMCCRFSLNAKSRRALIDFVKLLAGPKYNEWTISDHCHLVNLSKIFGAPDEATLYHFYCESCFQELEMPVSRGHFRNHETMCRTCHKSYSLTLIVSAPNYFSSIDLEYQILSLLNLKPVNEDLARNLANLDADVSRSPDYIRDVYDGSLYKKLLAETPRESRLLTCAFNTDGAPLFKSSKRAFWPILMILNELSPRVRFRYPLLAGMCVVSKEPSPDLINTYLRPFVKALKRLSTVGFYAQLCGKPVHFLLKPLFCSVDSVARPLLQNRLQFNGYFGCSWCYSQGQHINGCMRFLMEEPDATDRTHDDHIADVREALKKNRQMRMKRKKSDVRGVRGTSVLMLLDSFDMVWGFSRDYLHALQKISDRIRNL